ncbi:DNA gyrase inhibitor YacG [Bacteriovorax sp. PP10]|uniref:DNA gyrase inhibitor YacG n=1 Tax=Bacteriovorax antarcticus TaxID=3088717 RepID=A0ABU5VVF3_9BACT|nr:DNA gyrase inhibitor YacG [Bacteriovorax sp. PP10]MEA9356922.1 DNA gyrase inhibitor YacG [Bacteriovorax sp. PP10]
MNKKLTVKCPQCATEFSYYESEFRPFCTERCQQIDLGHWFQESYTVPDKGHNPQEEVENESKQTEMDDEEHNESDYH